MPSLQLIYAPDTYELLNRRSALGSYMATLAGLFHQAGYEVRINELPYDTLFGAETFAPAVGTGGRLAPLKRLLSLGLKQLVKDRRALRLADERVAEIAAMPPTDVILEFYRFGSAIGAELAQRWQRPLYIVYDGPVQEEYAFFHGIDPPLARQASARERDSLHAAAGIVVYSRPMRDWVQQTFDLPEADRFHLHQNVDFSRFEFDTHKPALPPVNIGFIGSFLRWHRVDLLLRAFERLRAEGHAARLWLVGHGQEWEAIRQQVAQSPYQADIELPGFKDQAELFAIKQQLHVGVVPSAIWYQAPNKLFEYGAMRIACVAPPTPTIADLYRAGEEIVFFDNEDEDSLYGALRSLLQDPARIHALGQAMYDKIRATYGPEKTLAFYEDFTKAQPTRSFDA